MGILLIILGCYMKKVHRGPITDGTWVILGLGGLSVILGLMDLLAHHFGFLWTL